MVSYIQEQFQRNKIVFNFFDFSLFYWCSTTLKSSAIIYNDKPLNDKKIHVAQKMLQKQFPCIQGLQDPVLKDGFFKATTSRSIRQQNYQLSKSSIKTNLQQTLL